MHGNEILTTLAGYKETIWLILTGFAGSITHILNKTRRWERLTLSQHVSYLVISWFVGYLTYLWCEHLWITWPVRWIIIGVASYSGIQIIEALEMFRAKQIYDLIIDFIMFKIGKWKK